MDDDLMIEKEIDFENNTFVSVKSCITTYKSLFNGFIACTKFNPIIYKALKKCYVTNNYDLIRKYHLLCCQFYDIYQQLKKHQNTFLLQEAIPSDFQEATYCYYNNEHLLTHWCFDKKVKISSSNNNADKMETMFTKLAFLKENGYVPDTIIDIGARTGKWSSDMKKIYPDNKYILIEALDYSKIYTFESVSNIHIFNSTILSDCKKQVDWYEMKETGDSIFKENSFVYDECEPIKKDAIDLDTFLLSKPDILPLQRCFIKIDTQGSEIPILKGAQKTLETTDFVLIEAPLFGEYNQDVPNFSEHISYMESIGFQLYDILENHIINGFNMQVDLLFININSDEFTRFSIQPTIHSVLLSEFHREHVITYVKEKKRQNPNYKVIDIGGSANYTSWSYSIIDYIVDINEPQENDRNIQYFKLNVCHETEWTELFDYVSKHGKFDFCICSHIIEDISLPQVLLNYVDKIALEGFIAVPSKYMELSKIEGEYTGCIHHRWIYTLKNNQLLGYPKLNFIDFEQSLVNNGSIEPTTLDFSFFWKNKIPYSIINDNYMGPNIPAVKSYYKDLFNDDLDVIKSVSIPRSNSISSCYPIDTVRQYKNVEGVILPVLMNNKTLADDLFIINNLGFVPYHIISMNVHSIGSHNCKIVFINKAHSFNSSVNEYLKISLNI